ncbi:MAG: Uma2 family endonuclease [Chloroflexota bacterium]
MSTISTVAKSTEESKPTLPYSNGRMSSHLNGGVQVTESRHTAQILYDPLDAETRQTGLYRVADLHVYLEEYEYSVELYNGWLVWQQMGDKFERTAVSNIQAMLDVSARKAKYGQALPDQTECRLNDSTDIMPDAALASWQRLEEDLILDGPDNRPLLSRCPELVIESRSKSNWRKQERLKRDKYFANGTLLIWDVDEPNKCIHVYRAEAPETPTTYGLNDIIDCETLLPGWHRRVADIFDQQASAEAIVGEVADEWKDEGRKQGHAEGHAEGQDKKALEIAQALLDLLDDKTISEKTGLSPERVHALRGEAGQL